jgi:hypothetical protein
MTIEWPITDFDIAQTVVLADVVAHFETWFAVSSRDEDGARESMEFDPNIGVLNSADATALTWQLTTRHTKESFMGIHPSGREVIVRGVTVLHSQATLLRRYIDWHDVLAQLGSLPGRAVDAAVVADGPL